MFAEAPVAELSLVAKDKQRQDDAGPLADGGESPAPPDYLAHVKVPLGFKERLERIAQHVNQKRKRKNLPKRALGWFVATHLEEWMRLAEDEIEAERP